MYIFSTTRIYLPRKFGLSLTSITAKKQLISIYLENFISCSKERSVDIPYIADLVQNKNMIHKSSITHGNYQAATLKP